MKKFTPFLSRHHLRKEIAIVLIIKFSLMVLIAIICFSHPIADHLSFTDLAKRFLEV